MSIIITLLDIIGERGEEMDYTELAGEFLQTIQMLKKFGPPQKRIVESMRGEYFALQFIARLGGEVLPGEICEEMDVSSARVAATLNSLENKGLITREINKSDRRQIIVRLTQNGQELADTHMQEILREAAMILSQLGEYDAKEFIRIIRKLVDIIPKRETP